MYITLASFFQKLFKSEESELPILIDFSLLSTNIKAIFFLLSSFPSILCQKSKKDHNYRYLPTAITLFYMNIFRIFYVHKVDRTVKFDII